MHRCTFLQLLNVLQANSQIEVELLQQQLKTSRKESTHSDVA